MTERGRKDVSRSTSVLAIGRSALAWRDDGLTISLDEWSAPIPRRIRGTVRLDPAFINDRRFSLESRGGHEWRPIAPLARVHVDLERPNLRWSGAGYLDTNRGEEPLQRAFRRWTWSRAPLRDGAAIIYEGERRRESPLGMALRFNQSGECEDFPAPPLAKLPSTRWRLSRDMRSDDSAPKVRRDFEDTPFYSRSLVDARWDGQDVRAMSETLSLDRFANPIVKAMLPFRMPRN